MNRRRYNERSNRYNSPSQIIERYISSNDVNLRLPISTISNPHDFLRFLINRSVEYQNRTGEPFILSLDDNNFITLSSNFRDQFLNNLDDFFLHDIEQFNSDAQVIQNFTAGNFLTITIQSRVFRDFIEDQNPNHRIQAGAFFNKLHKTKLDLSRYGLYSTINTENYIDNCLLKTFQNHKNISEEQITKLKMMIKYDHIPIKLLKKISESLKVQIKLYIPKENGTKRRILYFNKKETNIVDLGLLNNHYFIVEKTNYCKNDLHRLLDSKVKMDSYKLIKFLLEDETVSHLLKDISYNSDILKTQYYDKINNPIIDNLKYSEESYKLIKEQKQWERKEKNIIFFDFETYTDKKTNQHIPYLCCSIGLNDNIAKTFYGKDCGKKFLNHIKKDSIIIAHNATYDINFLVKYILLDKIIKKGNKIYQIKGKTLSKVKIEIKDSLLMISKPLRSFGKMFGLKQGKEVMNYDIYHDFFNKCQNSKIKKVQYKIDKAIKDFNEEDKKQFLKNIDEWNCRRGTKFFDLIEYSKRYCQIDCKVLRNGYKTFRKWILQSCELDINEIMTSASLADRYFKKTNCFEGCYELSGVPRQFIQNCLVGGRCMSNQNKKYNLTEQILDYDAVSLYPSAIDRLGGYLKGLPKILNEEQLNYDFLQKQDGYFIDIIINSVGVERDFPLLSIIKQNGVRNFTNDVVGKEFHIDKIQLEDLIKFQKITFHVVRGYFFNEGRNKLSKEVINFLFNERIKKKKEGNSIQEVYKLIMNSAYGKTIMKPIVEENKVFNNKEIFRNHYRYCCNFIKSYEKIDGFNKVITTEVKPIVEHFSRPHIGVEILSMSKRIMNEVMCLAEDNGIKIYYQDTDSMHLQANSLKKLKKLFLKEYKRVLDGDNMGQFNSDFSMKEDVSNNVHAKRTIILGKKCYIDQLVGCNKDDKEIIEHHCRMKGVPNASIKYFCEKNNITLIKLYEKLYNGEEITFDLLCGGRSVKFKQNKNFTICSLKSFLRKLKF